VRVRIARSSAREGARVAESRICDEFPLTHRDDLHSTTRRDARARGDMAPFLGGMRGLTVFVQDVRNCSNKVRRARAREG